MKDAHALHAIVSASLDAVLKAAGMVNAETDVPEGSDGSLRDDATDGMTSLAASTPRDMLWNDCRVASREDVYRVLATVLQERGVRCSLHRSVASLRDLSTQGDMFLVVPGEKAVARPAGHHAAKQKADEQALVVDLYFKERYALALSTAQYRAFYNTLEPSFVGTYSHLHNTLSRIATAINSSFREKHMDLPPWRAAAAMCQSYHYDGTRMSDAHVEAMMQRCTPAGQLQQMHKGAMHLLQITEGAVSAP
eukprot:TRINITY_DN28577_c0_g1_i1.p1 TRINITY_DN28577_c0_g1~~TRINITY_DN28577_c0_g1_i1.p1  ORF type:complete len:251 (+),score=70.54 TRINITY_DN28577_c0_g1_i1:58-810(+)